MKLHHAIAATSLLIASACAAPVDPGTGVFLGDGGGKHDSSSSDDVAPTDAPVGDAAGDTTAAQDSGASDDTSGDSSEPADTLTTDDTSTPFDTGADDTGTDDTGTTSTGDTSIGPTDTGAGGKCVADSECKAPFNCCDKAKGKCGLALIPGVVCVAP